MFTKSEKIRAVELLKASRRLLEARQYKYVCWCLEAAGHANEDYLVLEKMKEFINKRLGGYYTIGDWLINELKMRKVPNSEQMFEYRIRWVDSLIEEFS